MALSRPPVRRVRGAARVDTVSATRFGHAPRAAKAAAAGQTARIRENTDPPTTGNS
ncbi:TPA: hypothetical protein QDB06_005543 [Burkholderia vietnamiensis]|nr:hypothetical protein [Burkholderia vietnamiensis]